METSQASREVRHRSAQSSLTFLLDMADRHLYEAAQRGRVVWPLLTLDDQDSHSSFCVRYWTGDDRVRTALCAPVVPLTYELLAKYSRGCDVGSRELTGDCLLAAYALIPGLAWLGRWGDLRALWSALHSAATECRFDSDKDLVAKMGVTRAFALTPVLYAFAALRVQRIEIQQSQ